MRYTSIKERCGTTGEFVRANRRWAVVATIAVLAASLAPRAGRAETLRWKFKAGDVLRYTLEEKTASTSKVMGRELKSMRSHTINLSWNVRGVSANGDANVTMRFDRVRMHIEQPPFLPFDFDSSAAKVDAPEPFGSIGQQVKAMAGAEFTFKIKPSGAVENVTVPEQTVKALREGLGADAAAQGMFSEQGLKDILVQSSPPPFPEGSLEPGKSWSTKPSRLTVAPLGTMVIDKVLTFQGPDPKTPGLLLIGTETRVALEPMDNANPSARSGEIPSLSAKIGSQEGKGTLTFDAEGGRITSSRMTQKIDMQIMGPMEQKIDQSTETISTMTLEP
jgi:hypothetical protein